MAPKLTVPPVGQLLLAAILIAAVAFLTTLQASYTGAITVGLISASTIAGLVAFFGIWRGQPGTQIPWSSLLTLVVTALGTTLLWAAHQSSWGILALISGLIVFLTTLENEIVPAPPSPG